MNSKKLLKVFFGKKYLFKRILIALGIFLFSSKLGAAKIDTHTFFIVGAEDGLRIMNLPEGEEQQASIKQSIKYFQLPGNVKIRVRMFNKNTDMVNTDVIEMDNQWNIMKDNRQLMAMESDSEYMFNPMEDSGVVFFHIPPTAKAHQGKVKAGELPSGNWEGMITRIPDYYLAAEKGVLGDIVEGYHDDPAKEHLMAAGSKDHEGEVVVHMPLISQTGMVMGMVGMISTQADL